MLSTSGIKHGKKLEKDTRKPFCKKFKIMIVILTPAGVVAILFPTDLTTCSVSTEGGVASVGGSINLLLGRALL